MQFQVRAQVVRDGAVFEAIITAALKAVPARGWFTLPTVVKCDGEPVAGVVWSCHAGNLVGGFLHAVDATACHRQVFEQLTEALRAARPRTRLMAEVGGVG